MTTALQAAVDDLVQVEQRFVQGELSYVGYSDLRKPAITRALVAMAAELGVVLQQPLHIDANGEYLIVALRHEGTDPRYASGQFGKAFADALSRHHARYGLAPAFIDAANGWCRLFHMEAEKMVRTYARANGTSA